MLRKLWSGWLNFDWKLGLGLIGVFGAVRFFLVMDATVNKDFKYVSIIFIVMALTPFLLLNRDGLKSIGVRRPLSYKGLGYSFLAGIVACFLVYAVGLLLFQKTNHNWFVYIANAYPVPVSDLPAQDKTIYFIIFAVIGATFSPIGEELMYRGLIHRSLSDRYGDKGAAYLDSAAFGLTHLAHFGLVYQLGRWELLPIPALLWVILIFGTGLVFNWAAKRSGSIAGAVLSHAGFNIAMTYFNFYG